VLARVRRTWRDLPMLMQVGLAIAALGGAIDIGYHLLSNAAGAGHSPVAFTGHLVTLIGMVITLFGLFGAALRRRPLEAKTPRKGEFDEPCCGTTDTRSPLL
jgi:hypothetical protein